MAGKKKVDIKKHLSFAAGFLGDACFYQFMTAYLLVFLTGPAGMSAKNAGTVGSIIILADAICSLFVGRFTDGLKCRYGRRRPILLVCAFVVPLLFCMTYVTIHGTEEQKVAYYTATGFIFYAVFILYYISQTALGADIADDYDDSIAMNSIVSLVTNVSTLICLALPLPAISWMRSRGMSESRAWFLFVLGMSAFVVAGMLFCWNNTRGREKLGVVDTKSQSLKEMLADYRELLRIKPYRRLIETKFILNFCYTIYSNSMVFFITYNMPGDTDWITSFVYTFNTVLSFAVIPVVTAIAFRLGKKWMTVFTSLFYGVCGIVLYAAGISDMPRLLSYVLVHAVGVHGFWQLYTTNLYDVADLDEYRTGRRREGNIVGLQSFICGLSVSLTVRILTLLLDNAGFDGTAAVQTPAASAMLDKCFVLLPAVTTIAGTLVMSRYRIDRAGSQLVKEALSRREAGEPPLNESDTTKIEAMFR